MLEGFDHAAGQDSEQIKARSSAIDHHHAEAIASCGAMIRSGIDPNGVKRHA